MVAAIHVAGRGREGDVSGDPSHVQSCGVDDDLAYADVFTLRAHGFPAQALVERPARADRRPGRRPARRPRCAVCWRSPRPLGRGPGVATNPTRSGPLHGIPVLVKDNIEVVGLPSTAGATSLVGRPPTADAPLVGRLRQAGAIILGTTNLSEWANIRSVRSTSGWSAVGGLTGNPWALDRSAGGSSSGSGAALAAGLAPLAIGTETDGSITCPASLNGVAGIKPTVGAVPTAASSRSAPARTAPAPWPAPSTRWRCFSRCSRPRRGSSTGPDRGVGGLRVGVVRTLADRPPGHRRTVR